MTTTPTAPTAATTTVSVRDTGQLAVVVPHLLGFHPADSLVVLGMERGRTPSGKPTIGATTRVDLPAVMSDVETVWEVLQERLLPRCPDLVLLAYVPGTGGVEDPRSVAAEGLLGAIRDLIEAHPRTSLLDAAVVGEGSWRPLRCGDERCCPATLVPLPQPEQVRAVADLVLKGRGALADREALVALVRPRPDDPRSRELRRLLHPGDAFGLGAGATALPPSQPVGLGPGLDAWRVLLGLRGEAPADGWSAERVIDAVRVIADKEVRDGVLTWLVPDLLAPGMLDPEVGDACLLHLGTPLSEALSDHETREGVLDRLLDLCPLLPAPEAASVLTLTGLVAWSLGNLTLATEALERALVADPGYTVARLSLAPVLQHLRYQDFVVARDEAPGLQGRTRRRGRRGRRMG
ncbi:DUF4192 domain-containing protein [Arsenicicoccus sp. oral taxon 190]|uniref:DUF4192 domain-containing protein n=1 Tax=Arsenicicoccus sp. oral taxon 190 TaxID=1658671 RepID=UPI000679FF73|nr:DUF4192 domain-containing protein [Arsenicicoccus sp. oral taxon 190]AKT51631.1 hypothetical protein ADJ73_10600 [Arsenicicoccus sp. oral taxon 190]